MGNTCRKRRPQRPTPNRKIKRGKSMQKLIELLGEPNENKTNSEYESWKWDKRQRSVFLS